MLIHILHHLYSKFLKILDIKHIINNLKEPILLMILIVLTIYECLLFLLKMR